MASSLGSIDRKTEWAAHHIGQLDVQLQQFMRMEPYEIETRPRPGAEGWTDYVLRNPKPIPEQVPLRIGDIVHNIRTALDHLACFAVEANGGPVGGSTAFPIVRSDDVPNPADYIATCGQKLRGASTPVIDLAKNLEPWVGGADQSLHIVHVLDINDKHRELLVALFKPLMKLGLPEALRAKLPADSSLLHHDWPSVMAKGERGTGMEPLKDDDVLFGSMSGPEGGNEAYVEVALADPYEIQGIPVVKMLTDLLRDTRIVIDRFRPLVAASS